MHVNRTIEINHEAKAVMNKTIQSLACDVGGYRNLSFVEGDVKNHVLKERHTIGKEGDGKALRSYFLRMQEQNCNFFYDIDLDDFFRVKNVFWADARSRATYDSFGDVVTFDTTYLTKCITYHLFHLLALTIMDNMFYWDVAYSLVKTQSHLCGC